MFYISTTTTLNQPQTIDTVTARLYNENEVRQIADAAAIKAAALTAEQNAAQLRAIMSGTAKLEKVISGSLDISGGEDMSKEKRRVIIAWNDDGTRIVKQLTAANAYEMNDRIVKEYIISGRIKEFLSAQPAASETFSEYAQKWFEIYISTRKPSTIATYQKILRAILPAFGSKRLADITTNDIQQYLNDNKELSRKTLRERLARISQIFESAKEDGMVTTNPAKSKRITIPTDKAETREAIPLDVVRAAIAASPQLALNDRRMLLLLITTGGRRGEVLGLQWRDIDTENNVIHIRRNVTHPNGNVPIVGTPKTSSGCRDVPYEQAIRDLIDPNGKPPEGFVCCGASESEPMTMTMYNHTWRRIQKAIPELSNYSAHNFRHTYATMLSEYTDASMKTIQAMAGHKDIRTTIAIYEHACPEKITKASTDIHNLLFT